MEKQGEALGVKKYNNWDEDRMNLVSENSPFLCPDVARVRLGLGFK